MWPVTQKTVVIVKEIIKYSDGMMLQTMTRLCEQLQMCTCDHGFTTMLTLPQIKLYIKLHKQITSSLSIGSPSINETYNYIVNDEVNEEIDILKANRLIKLQDVAPNWVHKQALKQHRKY